VVRETFLDDASNLRIADPGKEGGEIMKDAVVLKKNPDVVCRQIEKETIIMPVLKASEDINCIYTLNKAASLVWDMVDGKRTVGQIKKAVLKKFDTTACDAEKKLQEFINDLKEIKAIG
jgi:methyltransferase-like protein